MTREQIEAVLSGHIGLPEVSYDMAEALLRVLDLCDESEESGGLAPSVPATLVRDAVEGEK